MSRSILPLVLLVLWCFRAGAGYQLGAGPFTAQNLGVFAQQNDQEPALQVMFDIPGGHRHLLLYYDFIFRDTGNVDVCDTDITAGTASATSTTAVSRPGSYCQMFYTNSGLNKVYFSSASTWQYDPVTKAATLIFQNHTNTSGSQHSGQTMATGDDGWVYVGMGSANASVSDRGGWVERYNPQTSVHEDLGQMDTSAVSGNYQAYTLDATTNLLFVSIGQAEWYLAVYDTANHTNQLWWKGLGDTVGLVERGKTSGTIYYERKTAGASIIWYVLTNNIPCPVLTNVIPPEPVYGYSTERSTYCQGVSTILSRFNTDIDLQYSYPDSGSNSATIGWRSPAGSGSYTYATATNFTLYPEPIHRMYSSVGNTMLFFVGTYGSVGTYSSDSGVGALFGRLNAVSFYDYTKSGVSSWLSGYDKYTFIWDESQPWTWAGAPTNFYSASLNPHQIAMTGGNYHYFTAVGADGYLYVATAYARGDTGAEVIYYNTNSGTSTILFKNTAYSARDLKPAMGGTKMVYLEASGKVYTFDVATKTCTATNNPVPGYASSGDGKIVEASPGIILGCVGTYLWKLDIGSNTILSTNSLGGTAFGTAIPNYDRRLDLGPDGNVWLYIADTLTCIKPSDCSKTTPTVTSLPSSRSIAWGNAGDMYLHGGAGFSSGYANVYRIANLLTNVLATNIGAVSVGSLNASTLRTQ